MYAISCSHAIHCSAHTLARMLNHVHAIHTLFSSNGDSSLGTATAQAHLHEVHLATQPELSCTSTAQQQTANSASSSSTTLRTITEPYPAVASFAFKSSPSICQPELEVRQTEPETEPANAVWSLLSLPEEQCRAVLCAALTACVQQAQCTLPPKKKRGTGAELFALLSALAKGGSAGSSSSSISKRSAMVRAYSFTLLALLVLLVSVYKDELLVICYDLRCACL